MQITILGAGTAGVAAAIALAEQGHDITIYERSNSMSTMGAGIVLWPNATYIMQKLGLLSQVQAVSGKLLSMKRLSQTGENLGKLDIKQLNELMGYSSYSIFRHELQSILLQKLDSLGVSVCYGQRVTAITQADKQQAVVTINDTEEIVADMFIAADGRMQSIARKYINGDNTPLYQNFINWVGTYETDKDIVNELSVLDIWGTGKRFGIVPVSNKKVYWAAGMYQPEIGTRIAQNYKQELTLNFKNWPHPVAEIIAQVNTENVNKIYVHDLEPIHKWHRQNMLLLGDCAHAPLPTSGQGACQALEDAWCLRTVLNQNNNDIESSFEQFTALRVKKTSAITYAARGFAGSVFNSNEQHCRQRNETSKRTDYAAMAKGMSELWGAGLASGA